MWDICSIYCRILYALLSSPQISQVRRLSLREVGWSWPHGICRSCLGQRLRVPLPAFSSIFSNLYGDGSIPINTIFSGMHIHLPAILGFTRYQGFDPSPYLAFLIAVVAIGCVMIFLCHGWDHWGLRMFCTVLLLGMLGAESLSTLSSVSSSEAPADRFMSATARRIFLCLDLQLPSGKLT